jgi:hypothetical protein
LEGEVLVVMDIRVVLKHLVLAVGEVLVVYELLLA